jgi:hypothetical protein
MTMQVDGRIVKFRKDDTQQFDGGMTEIRASLFHGCNALDEVAMLSVGWYIAHGDCGGVAS